MSGRRWIEWCLLLGGLAAVDVWLGSQAVTALSQNWESWVFDRQVRGESAPFGAYVADCARNLREHARARLGLPVASGEPGAGPPAGVAEGPPPKIAKRGLVGRLRIPRLHLSAMVREGDDDRTLQLALGHIPSTALPGQPGNVGVAGHRDTLFRPLRGIQKSDVIWFETTAGNYSYRVESTEIVQPENVSVLDPGRQAELTLVTCYPFNYVGSAPQRFIVRARQVAVKSSAALDNRSLTVAALHQRVGAAPVNKRYAVRHAGNRRRLRLS